MLEMEQASCAVCGKEFMREKRNGRRKVFCSEECRKEKHKEYSNRYNMRRYYSDADFRKHKAELNRKSSKKYRSVRKEKAWQELVDAVVAAQTEEEVRSILEERVRLKSDLYA